MQSIASNYSALIDFPKVLSSNEKGDAAGKASGLLVHLQKFRIFFSLKLMLNLFSCMETVSVALQKHQLHIQSTREMIDTLMKALWE